MLTHQSIGGGTFPTMAVAQHFSLSHNNTYIKLRDSTLRLLFGTCEEKVLNPQNGRINNIDSQSTMQEIVKVINGFKEQAIDSSGRHVNYTELRNSDIFTTYRKELTPKLRNIDLAQLGNNNAAKAFWINLYNALVINGVISFGVNQSVTEGWLGIVKFFQCAAYNVGGFRFSLEDIEHGILRANRGHVALPGPHYAGDDPRAAITLSELDARLHFALNCASTSCPPVGVYSAEKLDDQLDTATYNFVDHEVKLDGKGNRLLISSLFKWYAKDFGGKEGIIKFLLDYLPDDARRQWLSSNGNKARIGYLPYDWSLNI